MKRFSDIFSGSRRATKWTKFEVRAILCRWVIYMAYRSDHVISLTKDLSYQRKRSKTTGWTVRPITQPEIPPCTSVLARSKLPFFNAYWWAFIGVRCLGREHGESILSLRRTLTTMIPTGCGVFAENLQVIDLWYSVTYKVSNVTSGIIGTVWILHLKEVQKMEKDNELFCVSVLW